jgi:anti-sigma regulatory factor (Ser/Thr protein kinase)
MSFMKKINVPALTENLDKMLDFILTGVKELKLESKLLYQLRLASEEALVNIINYAYGNMTGNIEIAFKFDPESKNLTIQISDWGKPFDPLSQPEPDINIDYEQRKIGGLGIHMIRKIMNEVNYERINDKNVLTMKKYL